MKPNSLFILLFLFPLMLSAQTQVVLNDFFQDNKNGWNTEDIQYIYDEKNIICAKFTNFAWRTEYLNCPIVNDPTKDMYFESHIKISLNRGTGFTGLYFIDNSNLKKPVYYYLRASEYYFYVTKFDPKSNKTIELLKGEKKSPAYNTPVVIGIQQKGNVFTFFGEGEKLAELKIDKCQVQTFGIFVEDNMIANIYQFLYKQDRGEIKVAEETKSLSQKEQLNTNVNTKYQELSPKISYDGKTLYWTVENDPSNYGGANNQDIWYSQKQPNGEWGPRQNIGYQLNNENSNYVHSLLPDNNTLFIGGIYPDETPQKKHTYYYLSHKDGDWYTSPEEMKIKNFTAAGYNASWIAPSGKVMIIGYTGPETAGKSDLYVSFLKRDGSWTEPHNITALNTPGEDMTPFIAADNKTLYFSTTGRNGYGNADIFMSKRLDSTWLKWSEPVNLGPSINSDTWDAYYTIPASGDYAYFVSNGIEGSSDIYRVKLAENIRPEKVIVVSGKVIDQSTNSPLGANITYHDLETGKEIGIARSNPADGSYTIVLPYGSNYGFLAEKENYFSISDNLDLLQTGEYIEIKRDLYLSPIEIGKTLALNNVFFVRSKAELLPGSYSELDRLISVLKNNPSIHIELAGHTDNQGDAEKNRQLSEERVLAIKNYLVSKGISSGRISGKGYGGTKPIAPNDTEEHRKQNRRVEFSIVKK